MHELKTNQCSYIKLQAKKTASQLQRAGTQMEKKKKKKKKITFSGSRNKIPNNLISLLIVSHYNGIWKQAKDIGKRSTLGDESGHLMNSQVPDKMDRRCPDYAFFKKN